MDSEPAPLNSNVQRQLAIFQVAGHAAGKGASEIKAMLEKALAEQGLLNEPAPWLDAVAAAAAYGEPYIVDLPSAVVAESIAAAPDRHVQQTLLQRRLLRESEDSTRDLSGPRAVTPPREEGKISGGDSTEDQVTAHEHFRSYVPFHGMLRIATTVLAAAAAVAALHALRRHLR